MTRRRVCPFAWEILHSYLERISPGRRWPSDIGRPVAPMPRPLDGMRAGSLESLQKSYTVCVCHPASMQHRETFISTPASVR